MSFARGRVKVTGLTEWYRAARRWESVARHRFKWAMRVGTPRIAGLTRIRNEEAIIADALDHHSNICNAGIYVYDDCSTDTTVAICRAHPSVVDVVEGLQWNRDRLEAEFQGRQAVLERALADGPDWFLYFDADERVELDMREVDWRNRDAVIMKLYDFYITEEDVNLPYTSRRLIGPEYREILMLFRNMDGVGYRHADQRESSLPEHARVQRVGDVRHYGKAISVEEWEETCNYYCTHFPEPYRSKWLARRGRAVHTLSDFGRELISWEERQLRGLPLDE